MKIPSPVKQRGFSLVELLLTLVLILCLAAASVFSYTAMHRTANLDEGVDRLQSLIRFAQAEAATSGRKVQLQFELGARPLDVPTESLRNIKVMVEADALNAPGVFLEHTNKAWSEQLVNELVGVKKVQPIDTSAPSATDAQLMDDSELQATADPALEEDPFAIFDEEFSSPVESFPAITFYPDGSCDSAEIILASRNDKDGRMLSVKLSGILGEITSQTLASEDSGEILSDEALDDSDLAEIFDSPPASSSEPPLASF